MSAMENDEQTIVAAIGAFVRAVQSIANGTGVIIVPARIIEIASEPRDVGDAVFVVVLALEEFSLAHHPVCSREGDRLAKESHDVRMLANPVPVEPAELVVLTVRIVVPALRAQAFVSPEHHGRAKRKEQHARVVLDQLLSKPDNGLIARVAFGAAIP